MIRKNFKDQKDSLFKEQNLISSNPTFWITIYGKMLIGKFERYEPSLAFFNLTKFKHSFQFYKSLLKLHLCIFRTSLIRTY
jgi:hypothetical protein